MDNKLNEQQIGDYSSQVAQKLIHSFFANKDKISGEEILNLCAIKQVNLFVLKGLFQKWNKESEKLESPYFDYNDPEVVAAVERFKNTVSRHILIDKASFEPILIAAISDTIMLICSPYHFYLNELNWMKEQSISPIDGLGEGKKFTKINGAILDALIEHVNQSTSEQTDATTILDHVIGNMISGPDEMDDYIKAFSNYVTLDINDIYLEVDTAQVLEAPALAQPDFTISETAEDAPTDDAEERMLNDLLAPEKQISIADMHEQQKIQSLSKGITLNQRFMFVNVLFDGDVAKFNNTVLEIDGLVNLDEAKHYLSTRFDHWNETAHEVEEFMKILERRFS
jgi:hypothetical protein